MLDRVREALFSTLGDAVQDARVLDLFAGTGSLGIEALSRGARRARFVERDRRVQAVLRGNLESLGLRPDEAEVRGGDALAEARSAEPGSLELVFLDPPYPWVRPGARERAPLLAAVARLHGEALAPGGVLVLHVPPREVEVGDLPAGAAPEARTYGRSTLWYLWR